VLRPEEFAVKIPRGLRFTSLRELFEKLALAGLSLNYEFGPEVGLDVRLGSDALTCSLDELSLPEGVKKPLHWSGIHTVADLTAMSPQQLLSLHGIGIGALRGIVEALRERHLFLGSQLESKEQGEHKAAPGSADGGSYTSNVEIIAKSCLAEGANWWEFKRLGRELLKWKRNTLAWECYTRAIEEARKISRACELIYPDMGV